MKNTNEDQDQMSTSSTLTGSSGRSVSVGDVHVEFSEVKRQVNGNQPPVRHKRQSSTNEDLSLKQAEDVKELPNATELNVGVSRNLGDVVAPCTSSVIVDINCEEGSQDKGNQPPGTPTSKCRQPEHNDDLSMTWKNDSQQTSQGHSKNSDVGKDGRADIPKKNEARHHLFEKLSINKIRTFPYFSIKVLLQMALVVLGILMCQKWKLYDGEGIGYVVSSILLLLSIFINGNYQRCEKAHEALSQLSSCLQDCNPSSGLAGEFLKTTDNKSKELKSKVEEYLSTKDHTRRKLTLSELQGSKEFSELRKIKEFQLPQTILFYSEILTFFVPIMLCPNFAHIGIKWDNIWSPYYEAVKIVILFEMFQICQDYFINPFANASDILHFDSDASALNHSDCDLSAEIKSERSQADRYQPPDDTNGNDKDLERHIAKFGLEIENIPKDWDCAFRSILRQLRKMDFDKTEELKDHLRSLNLMTESEDDDISTLRLLFVQECKKRTDEYSVFFPGPKTMFIEELMEFERKGVFDNAVGDLVARVCCDLLRVPITIVTSSLPKEETEFKPDRLLSNSPIFIAYHHHGAGHYDATNFIPTSEAPNKTVTSCLAESSTNEEQPDDKKQQHPNVGQATPRELEKTITRTFVCLAGRDQLTVPTNREKLLLKENGLGEKKLQIPTNASKEQVKEVLYKAFRPLQSCGGFEMLLCADNSRTRLQVVNYGSCNTDKLRWLGMSRVYIRPIQVDIPLGDIEDDDEQAEECLLCRESIPLRGMRAHMETCRSETRPAETSDDDLPPAFGERREPVPYEEHMRNALEETLKAMATCDEPVAVLGEFRRRLQRGRMLDLQNDSELCEGKTTKIFVSRDCLFDDAMEEILRDDPAAIDLSVPLEVIYTGEGARDYGGPRREFLGMVMRKIRDKLFKEEGEGYIIFEKKEALVRKHYYGAGLFFGFSLLQGGPLPTFLAEDQLQRIFKKDDLTNLGEAETQFRVGLERFGLVELHHGKPSLSFLFRKTAVLPMTYPKLVKLLDPIFSDEVTNQRRREERKYRLFLNYLKEVSAGRRMDGNVSLHSILKFVTGRENEPVLGFQMKPTICFGTNMPSCLPTGNTCINRLTLPIDENVPMTQEEVFSFFDYAFANDDLIDSL